MKRTLKRFCVFVTVLAMIFTLGTGVYAAGVEGETEFQASSTPTASNIQMTSCNKVSDTKCNITISWEGDADSYVVYAENAKKGTTTNKSFVVKNLVMGNYYTLRVVPKNSDSTTGDEATRDILAIYLKGSGKDREVKLSWTEVEGESEYTISTYHNESLLRTETSDTNSKNIVRLTNDEQYRFVVSTANGISPMSEVIIPRDFPESIEANKKLKAYPGYQSVTLEWEKVDDCEGYVIERSPKGKNNFEIIQTANIPNDGSMRATDYTGEYKDPSIVSYRDSNNLEMYQEYDYRIWAVNGGYTDGTRSEKYVSITEQAVRPVRYSFTMKTTVTLTGSKGDLEKKKTFTSGTRINAGNIYYSGGYTYTDKDGYSYRISRTVVTNNKMDYRTPTQGNYDKQTAYNFMNEAMRERPKSMIPFHDNKAKKYAIWTSFNTQHVYVYKRDDNDRWQIIRDFECATGKASTPSPTGWNLSIGQKVSSRHGLSWWSTFSSWNSFHGKLASWPVGNPASAGCVRCTQDGAKYIYSTCPTNNGTRVVNH